METVGVIAEYNPLHRGHLRHLALTRAAAPGALLTVCLSGNWVQRGDCAVADKWARARWAVEAGADLVLELPTPFALSSAEGFARAGTAILAAAGCDGLSFGCETPDLPALRALADVLDSPAYPAALRPHLAAGLSFPLARQRAAEELAGPRLAALLALPNNNLAVEYLRALPPGMAPLPIPRSGVHDAPALDPAAPSASALRSLLRRGRGSEAAPALARPWEGPVYDLAYLERTMLARFRAMTAEDWAALPDAGDGAGRRLWRAAQAADTLEGFYALAQTRRLTLARLRRTALCALLGLTAAGRDGGPAYLRVLALNRRGAEHLAALRGSAPLPVIVKPARARALLADEARYTDLFSLCAPQPLPPGREFSLSPFYAP